MSMPRQTILASRPAAMVLALTLVAGLTTPFVLLPRAHAQAAATPLPCTEANQNGCTELSPTPPQDTVAVPPNIVLMLDDSGSMGSDYMPDWGYINTANSALINSNNNGTYYNPAVPYTPPPHADGTLFTNYTDMTSVPADGFNPGTNRNLTSYSGNYSYSASRQVTSTTASTYSGNFNRDWKCQNEYNNDNGFGGYTYNNSTGQCTFTYYPVKTYRYFQYSTGPANGPYVIHYVAPAGQGCGPLSTTTTPDCVLDTSPTGLKDANNNDISIGQNIANWFAYDHTRILLAKTGLMTAFSNLNPAYRFGFASINANNLGDIPTTPTPFTFDDSTSGGGNSSNLIAAVQPFGAALDANGNPNTSSQRYKFWTWIQNESANNNTPLRKALNGAGQYYQTSDQPWSTMSSDPGYTAGSTTKFACRASYTILTTDGFWNGQNPTTPAGVIGAANKDGPVYTPPTGKVYTTTQYKAVAPFSGGGVSSSVASLADVATYYWETDLSTMPDEVAPSTQDPAFWQHMTTFTMGLGFTPTGIGGTDASGNPVTIPEIFAWAQGGPAISNFSWPTPSSNSINNIADLAHAAVNGHGDFFSVKSPQDLAAGFARAIAAINARNVEPTPSAVNVSVLTAGALTFATGYNTGDWSGSFKVVELNADGSPGASVWPTDPDTLLNTNFHGAGYTARKVYSAAYNSTTDTFSKFQFNAAAAPATTGGTTAFDATELAGLQSPALGGGNDTTANRINYLLGDNEFEGAPFRSRSSGILGAVINASPVYVSGAASNYNGNWPSGSVELTATQSYDDFVNQQASVPGTVYVAANDGMLHAFNAPAPKCNAYAADGSGCTSWDYGTNPGKEAWAFVPRAVYANLGNLTSAIDFSYRPTVDSTPVSRDVFFGESGATNTDNKWHTILTGGVGLGGRGVYALDITNPATFTQSNVLWEFDSDMKVPSACVSIVGSSVSGTCAATDLGYTVAQPNVGRLADGTWAVVVPNGYFPDCSTPDYPTANVTACNAIAAQAPKYSNGHPYSALFVLDAQTGSMIAELKTPDLAGVTSYGLATPVMGNLSNNNVDNVAYAGDVEGNLWKFTLGGTGPSAWTVSLVYQAATQGAQPITSMPRLFPDPVSNGFMVVFGTGKFLGVGDNSNSTVQSIYGVRDGNPSAATAAGKVVILGGSGTNGLTQNYLHEFVAPATIPNPNGTGTIANPHAGETLRCITGAAGDTCAADASAGTAPTMVADSSNTGGWYVNLDVEVAGKQANAGERVVVNPGAIFASSTVVFESLITGAASSDPCSPTTTGAVMALNAVTGAPAGVSSLGGWPIVGGRINNARTSGSLPLVSALGGGQAYLPGTGLAPTGTTPFSVDAPIWRRRSWSEINPNQ